MAFADTFKALSDPVRRDILLLLRCGKMSAGDIAEHFDMTNATISYHLAQLEKADLVFKTKYKNYIFYELNTSVFEEIMMWFSQFMGGEAYEDKKGKQNECRAEGRVENGSEYEVS